MGGFFNVHEEKFICHTGPEARKKYRFNSVLFVPLWQSRFLPKAILFGYFPSWKLLIL